MTVARIFAFPVHDGFQLQVGRPPQNLLTDTCARKCPASASYCRSAAQARSTRRLVPLQMQSGVYNETAFKGLDTVIYEASRAGLRLIIALANNWDYSGDSK